jgi:hypothetical protein
MALANRKFQKEIRSFHRNRMVVSIKDAKSIGVLYNATEIEDFEIVKTYVRNLLADKKEVTSLGYVDKKELPANQFAKLGLDFFTRKNLNWYMVPNSPLVTNFINEDFDILINLNIGACFPLQYISAISKAKYRVGQYDIKNAIYYDLMIHTPKNETLKHFIEQTDYYLNQITT